jgi:protein-tyrosine phosphatase
VTAGTARARFIDLDGAVNFRDLGGLEVEGGGRTASGVLLRADNLQGLSARDVVRLVEELGLRVVIDLRTREEVALEGPGPLARDGRVEIRHRSLFPESGQHTDVSVEAMLPWQGRPLRGDPEETVAVRSYLGYLRDRPDSIVGALRDVAFGDGAAVVHCAAGKDRTGVVCALALAAVGVPRAAIVADYVATGERLGPLLARLRSSPTYAEDLAGRPDESHRPRPETMARVLELLDEHSGGPCGWLDGHGFGAAELSVLRDRLVA